MQLEITTTKRVKETIEVEFPYYYKQDLTDYDYEDTCVLYGRKTESEDLTIREKIRYNNTTIYEIEKEEMNHSYFGKEYKSTEKEFEEAKDRAKNFINNLK